MKIGNKWGVEDDKFHYQATHDATNALHNARMLRDSGNRLFDDSRCLGSIPMAMAYAWAAEAGVSFDDHEAFEEVVVNKLLSGEFAKFQVDKG